jgi:RecB family exonuclease
VGNAVHHALERFFGVDPELRSPDLLERALRSVWTQHRKRGSFASSDEERAAGLTALRLLENFAARFDLQVIPLARERWVSKRLESGIAIFGKVDRIDRGTGDGIEIVDYKTGRRTLEAEDLPGESSAHVYLVAAEAISGLEVERIRYLYLDAGEEITWAPERDDVEAIQSRLGELTREIATTETFPAVPGAQCRWCDFALRCPESQRVDAHELVPVEGLPF